MNESESEESESTPAGSKEEPEAPSKVENHVTNQSKPEEKPKDDKVAISTSIQGGGSSTHGGSAGSASTEKASLLHRGVWCVIHSIGKRLYIDFLEVLSVLATADFC